MVKLTRSKTVSDKKSKTPLIKGDAVSSIPKKTPTAKKKTAIKKQKEPMPLKSFIQIKKEILPPKNHKVTIVDKTKNSKEEKVEVEKAGIVPTVVPTSKLRVRPAILSSYQFPLLSEKYIGTVSKVAGIFLVVSGVFFSFLNIYAGSEQYAQLPFFRNLANLIGSQTAQTIAKTTLTVTNTRTQVDAENPTNPIPRIVVDANQPFSGTVPVSVIVPYAINVTLLLEHKSDKRLQILGEASRVDAMTWKFDWKTAQYDDGEYSLKTIVKTEKGTYEGIQETVYVLSNNVSHNQSLDSESLNTIPVSGEELTEAATSTHQDTASTTETVAPSLSKVFVEKSDEFSSENTTLLRVSVFDATEVKLYAKNEETSAISYIGLARQKTPETWYVEWNTLHVPSGPYAITAKARINDTLSESEKITVSVTNATEFSAPHTGSSTADINETVFKPEITFLFSKEVPLSEKVTLSIQSSQMSWIELYAQPTTSLTPFFLGLAIEVKPNEWKFVWETTQTPNGEYHVYARGKTPYGFVEGSQQTIRIANGVAVAFTESEEKKLDSYIEANNALTKKVEDTDFLADSSSSTVLEPEEQAYVQPVSSFIKEVGIHAEVAPEVETVLTQFRVMLQEKLERLSLAARNGNQEEVQNIVAEIDTLKQDTITHIPTNIDDKDVVLRVEGYIYQIVSILQELTINNERILKERIGDAVTLDTDKDEISDYDEINIYKTNPFVADTDGDSFIDGLEVQGGYDPHNSAAEALVAHESPRENGVVRDDLLTVESVTALRAEVGSTETETTPARAVIAGRGLPYSFVTIYVYSTPVVVTVRTDANGKWNYIFDKELEEGNHEVYIGITNNEGRIVAKSKPLTFTKSASAFTSAVTESVPVPSTLAESFDITQNMMLLLGSVLVIMLGLILSIIGVHVTKKSTVLGLTTVS